MDRPKIDFEIKHPKAKSPVQGRDNPCGTSWHDQLEVRAPYKNTDKYLTVLPIMMEMGPYFTTKSTADHKGTEPDLEASLPSLVEQSVHNEIKEGIDGAQEWLDKYDDEGYIDSKNRSSIQGIINRARKYYDHARALQNYWKDSYQPDPSRGPRGWPLQNEHFGSGCDYKVAPDEGGIFTFGPGGAETVNFTCPTQTALDQHNEDRLKYFKLLKAALVNARCAQEAAAAVGTYFRNKEFYDKQPGAGMSVKYAPKKKAIPKMGVAKLVPETKPEPPPEPEPPVIPEVDEEPEPEPTAPAKKKKDNTMLIVGAAALGLLMLRK